MTRRTYTLEPQRLVTGQGYVLCEPHQACRIAIKEITVVPPKSGRKTYRVTKTVDTFHGAGALERARTLLSTLTRGTKPAPRRGILFRSLTRLEYDRAVASGLTKPEPKWKRFPPNWKGSSTSGDN